MNATKPELTEEQLFHLTARHPELLSPKFEGSYTNRRAQNARATAWFMQQFDVGRLREALESKTEWDPDGPMDLKWMVGRLREIVRNGKPGIAAEVYPS